MQPGLSADWAIFFWGDPDEKTLNGQLMITQTSIFDCALTYASYGYKLLPLKGKRPTLPGYAEKEVHE